MASRRFLLWTAALAAVAGAAWGCGSSSVDPADDGSKPAAPVDPKTLTPPPDLPTTGPKGGKH